MPKTILEGDTRINPETGIEEVYVPEGDFIPVTERPEAVNKSSVSTISTDDGEDILDQTKKKFENQYGLEDETTDLPTDTKDVVIEEDEKEGGYTFEEAQEIWGNDFTGIKRGDDGLFYPDSSAYERAGVKGMGEDLQEEVDETDQIIEDEYDKWQEYNVEEDPAFISQQRAITAQYATLRRQMEKKNKARQRAFETIGYRHGTRQYAGGIQLGIEGEELKQAGQRLADITSAELAAKSAARVAFENNEYTRFSQKVDALQTIRQNKADALTAYNESLIAANKAIAEQIKEEREADKDERERQESVTENLANLVLASGTGDTETDMAFIKSLADEYGIDPNMLASEATGLQTEMENDLMTTDIKEYRLAVGQGYEGTFKEWQKEQKGEELVSGGGGSKWKLDPKTGKYTMVVPPVYKPDTKKDEDGDEGSLTAGQVRDIKYLPDPPQWFSQKWEKKLDWRIPQKYPTERIQEEWDKLRVGDEDKEETVWAWLATPEAQALSDEEKKPIIMGYGLNPDDFNIY